MESKLQDRAAEAKHTPGPWESVPKLSGSENHRGLTIYGAGDPIADVRALDEDGNGGTANASLIAAAPDLLAACKRAIMALAANGAPNCEAVKECKAAIARAEGGAN